MYRVRTRIHNVLEMPGDGLELRCWRTRQVSASPGKQDLEVKRCGAQQPAPWQRVKQGALAPWKFLVEVEGLRKPRTRDSEGAAAY